MPSADTAIDAPDDRTAPLRDRCCTGCGHLLRGVRNRACPECGRAFDPEDPDTTGEIRNLGLRRGLIGTCRFLHHAFIALAAGIVLYAGLGGHWILIAMIVVGSLPVMLLQFGLLALPIQPISARRRLAGFLAPLLLLSIPFTDWPIRLNFMLHRSGLQAIADRVTSGETFEGALRVGAFRFRQVRTAYRTDHVGFQINGGDHGGMYFVATPAGFVAPASRNRAIRNVPRVWDNTNWTVDLGGGWYLVDQD